MLEPRLLLAAVSWDGGGGNPDWGNALNWSNDLVPGPADDVTIDLPGGQVFLVSGTHAINSLTSNTQLGITAALSIAAASALGGTVELGTGAALNGAGDLTINGTLRQRETGNTISGDGDLIVSAGGTYEVSPTQTATGTLTLARRVTVNPGGTMRYAPNRAGAHAWRWTGAHVENDGLFVVAPVVHPLDTPWGISFPADAQSLLVNHGTTRFAPPTNTHPLFSQWQFTASVENRGTFDVPWGVMRFDNATIANHGTIRTTSPSAKLDIRASSSQHFPGASLEGPGTLWIGGPLPPGTHVFAAGTFNPTGVVGLYGGTIELSEPFTGFTLEGNEIHSTSLVFNTPQTLNSIDMAQGSIRGPGDVTFAGTTTWRGDGTIAGPGRRIVPAGATLNMPGGFVWEPKLATTLEVFGTMNRATRIAMNNGIVHVKPGGTFNDNVNLGPSYEVRPVGGTNALINEGTFNKNGTAQLTFPGTNGGVRFDNAGQFNVHAGTVSFGGGGTTTGTTTVDAFAALHHGGAGYMYHPDSTLTGGGYALFVGGGPFTLGNVSNLNGGLDVGGNGTRATFNGNVNLSHVLNLTSGARAVLNRGARAAAVFVDGNSALDLKDQALVIDYGASSELANVRGSLSRGYNGGAWNGLGGINSSTAAANPGHALGYAEAADVLTNLPTTWAGHQVDATSVLVRYTRYGDANLDRTVNLDDFNRLVERFGQTGTLWSQGNFNYDNTTNLNDFNLLAANFGQSVSALVDRATRPGDTPAEDDRV